MIAIMNPLKISKFFVLATLPFLASCASWNTATISNGLKNGSLTYAQAEEALNNGGDVKESWAGKCLLEEAAKQNRQDLIKLFVEKGGVSCFEAASGYKEPFSLFMYAYEKQDEDLMLFCLKHQDKSREVMRNQLVRVANQMFDVFVGDPSRSAWASMRILSAICETGVLTTGEQVRFSLSSIHAVKAKKFLARCLSGNIRRDGRYRYTGVNFITREEANAKDESGNSALILFLKNCDWLREEDLEAFVSAGADVTAKSSDGESVLWLCWKHRNCKSACLEILRKAGARFTKEEATSLLTKRVKAKKDSGVGFTWDDLISQGADVNAKIGGHSLLYVATRLNNSECISVLEGAGAKLLPEEEKLLNEKRDKAWKEALANWNEQEIVKGIKAGANTSMTISDGGKSYSLLYWAEMRESKEIIALLKAAGAQMSESERKSLPAQRAARKFRSYCHNGAWGKIADEVKNGTLHLNTELKGENAFHWIASGEYGVVSFFREKAIMIDESFIVALKKSGVNINKKSDSKMTPLAVAIENANAEATALFLRHGANPDDTVSIKGSFGDVGKKTLMSFAIDRHNLAVNAFQTNYPYLDEGKIREFKEYIKRAKEIVSLMSEATGMKVTDL